MTVARTGTKAKVTLTCKPPVLLGQEVSLLLGSRPTPADPISADTSSVSFTIAKAHTGSFPVRLRVGGVDSRLVADRTDPTPSFEQAKKVTVT